MSVAGNGATTVPLGSVGPLDVATKYSGGVLESCTILPTADGAPLVYAVWDDTANMAGQQAAEGDEVTGIDEPLIGGVTLGAYTYGSGELVASNQVITDTRIPFEQQVVATCHERINRKANAHLTTGDGTGEPQGIVTGSTLGKTAAAVAAITYEELLDLVHSVDPSYRMSPNAGFMLHDSTLAAIRKLKDGDGRYIFSAGENGAPATILGYRFHVNNDMAQLTSGAGSRVVLFGDLSRYVVRRVALMYLTRLTEKHASKFQTGFVAFERLDGKLVNTAAVKHLKLAAE
jgi:HK97 family phage major capsid protein